MNSDPVFDREALRAWLEPLDALPLECDGMSRVVSALLTRDSICHLVCTGRLEIDGVGVIPRHWWIELGDGVICDWRARMWLGEGASVPHGFFEPRDGVRYVALDRFVLEYSPLVFEVLAGRPLEEYAAAPEPLAQ